MKVYNGKIKLGDKVYSHLNIDWSKINEKYRVLGIVHGINENKKEIVVEEIYPNKNNDEFLVFKPYQLKKTQLQTL